MYSELKSTENIVGKMVKMRAEFIAKGVENLHVKISHENSKTGAGVSNVSLIPVADCPNCKACEKGCYDVRHDCIRDNVAKNRAINSAILWVDPAKYFAEIEKACKFLRFFRWHIGGDMVSRSYFLHVLEIAQRCPHCEFLIFTSCTASLIRISITAEPSRQTCTLFSPTGEA